MERMERFYFIHRTLKKGGCLPLETIMDELQVSRATVFRDIEYLQNRFRAPIFHSEARGGYCYDSALATSDRFELPGIWFSDAELQALKVMNVLLEDLADGILGDAVLALRQRINLALGREGFSSEDLSRRIKILEAGKRRIDRSVFSSVASAVLNRQRILIEYAALSTGVLTERTLSPQRLVHYRGNWYLDAFCHLREEARAFSLAAIRSAEIVDEAAWDMSPIEIDHAVGANYGVFVGTERRWALLRFSESQSRYASIERWHEDQVAEFDASGCLTLKIPFASEAELIMDILRQGDGVEVVEPESLRRRVGEIAASIARKYGDVKT